MPALVGRRGKKSSFNSLRVLLQRGAVRRGAPETVSFQFSSSLIATFNNTTYRHIKVSLSILFESYCNGFSLAFLSIRSSTFNSLRVLLQPASRPSKRPSRQCLSILFESYCNPPGMTSAPTSIPPFNSLRVLLQRPKTLMSIISPLLLSILFESYCNLVFRHQLVHDAPTFNSLRVLLQQRDLEVVAVLLEPFQFSSSLIATVPSSSSTSTGSKLSILFESYCNSASSSAR